MIQINRFLIFWICTIIFVLNCLGNFQKVLAQVVVNTTGRTIKSYEGSISYSVGQVVFKTKNTAIGSVNEGIQQSYDTVVLSSINQVSIIKSVKTYPNPVIDFCYLRINVSSEEYLYYQILDINGKHLTSSKINSTTTKINMKPFSAGIYVLNIHNKEEVVSKLKIIKK